MAAGTSDDSAVDTPLVESDEQIFVFSPYPGIVAFCSADLPDGWTHWTEIVPHIVLAICCLLGLVFFL
jgi:hypothetical protein